MNTSDIPLTAQEYRQFVTDVLQACHQNIDLWVAKARQLYPGIGDLEALQMAHQHVTAILNAIASGTVVKQIDSPLGDPSACMNQYRTYLINGGRNCFAHYLECLQSKAIDVLQHSELFPCPVHQPRMNAD